MEKPLRPSIESLEEIVATLNNRLAPQHLRLAGPETTLYLLETGNNGGNVPARLLPLISNHFNRAFFRLSFLDDEFTNFAGVQALLG